MRMSVAIAALAAPLFGQAPKELGAVDFARDLDAVLAKKPDKPVFLQFQEVPG